MTSFGTPDAKRFMQRYFDALATPMGADWALQQPCTELGILSWLENVPFKEYPDPQRGQLAQWAFVQALTNGFLQQSANDKNTYFLSDVFAKKIGRPRKYEF